MTFRRATQTLIAPDSVRSSLAALLRGIVIVAALVLAPALAEAQEEGAGASFLDPFPPGDVYSVLVAGDDYAEGLQAGMAEAFAGDARVGLRPKSAPFNGLMRPDFDDKLKAFGEDLKKDPVTIAVVMLGAWDRVSSRDAAGNRVMIGTPAWKKDYASRADRLLRVLRQANVAVYLAGLPGGPQMGANEDAQMMNDILRERAYLNGAKYIDTFADFAGEDGGFSQWGPDITGKIVRLRLKDGVYFTPAGNQKLAHFVERELRRDINQAKANRNIPLAGSEDEQARINPDKAKLAPEGGAKGAAGAAAGMAGGMAPAGEKGDGTTAQTTAADGEQKADNGKISLRTTTASGREETVTVDILRPAISAQVVQLVTRRESPDKPSQMGATLTDHIPGGLTVMSSVTPDAGSGIPGQGGPKLSAAQTPYFRVLFKGERLPSEPGRADDVSWPRPEPPAPGPPEETGSTLKPTAAAGEPDAPPQKNKKTQKP